MSHPAPTPRRIIVSGASRGIGRAIAEAFARDGASVGLLARSRDALEQTSGALRALGAPDAPFETADTAHGGEVGPAVARLIERLGGVDTLVNSAAVPAGTVAEHAIGEYDESHLRDELETKVLGYLRTIKAVAPTFVAQRWGRVVNIGGQSLRHTGSISATVRNAAVVALSKNLADELGPAGVTVNVVHPGFTGTADVDERLAAIAERRGVDVARARHDIEQRSSIRSIADADEVAQLVLFLASEAGRAVNGESISVGGSTAGFIFQY